ncbi:hypothetical protein C2857_001863 [Epichloe festucae Fl1]|uniref:Uncharacterized protein n=1 Tax=Epichloe festucae (strain Fl1) TaxID=877507 RepID=A0A7U3PZZ0_EPIFF|nr:hypothetical protein C2857_001863 [Epichloe festucae Fl1]
MAGNDTSLRSSLMSEEQSLSNPSPKRDQLKPRQAQNQYFARQRTKLILRSVASSARAGRVSVYAVAIGAEGYGVVEVVDESEDAAHVAKRRHEESQFIFIPIRTTGFRKLTYSGQQERRQETFTKSDNPSMRPRRKENRQFLIVQMVSAPVKLNLSAPADLIVIHSLNGERAGFSKPYRTNHDEPPHGTEFVSTWSSPQNGRGPPEGLPEKKTRDEIISRHHHFV